MVWNRKDDDKDLVQGIVRLGNLGIRLRAQGAKEKVDEANDIYEYSPAIVEGPARYLSLLYNLARGNAIAEGRSKLEPDDLTLLTNITLSSAPQERRNLLMAVLNSHEPISTDQAATAINCSLPTARAVIGDMWSLPRLGGAME